MPRARKWLSLILWLLYGLAVAAHVSHHLQEAAEPISASGHEDGPCSDCVALGALGLLLVTAPRLPAALTRFATAFLTPRTPAVAPHTAPRRRPHARGPPPR